MSIIKSFSVGCGDMFYIRHNSNNFTIIDCNLPESRAKSILAELSAQIRRNDVVRFISTHPDQDHISGLVKLDDHLRLQNFYCVANKATKANPTADFRRYCELRDSAKAFHVYQGRKRRWMNVSSDERGSSGITVLWPVISDPDFQSELRSAAAGGSPNNISPIIRYSLVNGVKVLWMGDLETEFMEKIQTAVPLRKVDILFAPHHGRDSGKVPVAWLKNLDPALIVIGEAPHDYLNYYRGYNTLTQNSTGDILFDCQHGKVHVYIEDGAYVAPECLRRERGQDDRGGLHYLGTLAC